jgi:hypothetical protein
MNNGCMRNFGLAALLSLSHVGLAAEGGSLIGGGNAYLETAIECSVLPEVSTGLLVSDKLSVVFESNQNGVQVEGTTLGVVLHNGPIGGWDMTNAVASLQTKRGPVPTGLPFQVHVFGASEWKDGRLVQDRIGILSIDTNGNGSLLPNFRGQRMGLQTMKLRDCFNAEVLPGSQN